MVFLSGRVSRRDEEPKIVVTDIKRVHDVYRAIKTINVDLAVVGQEKLKDLRERLSRSPGSVPVYLRLDTKSHKSVQILVGEDLFVTPNEHLMNEIKELVGEGNFSLTL